MKKSNQVNEHVIVIENDMKHVKRAILSAIRFTVVEAIIIIVFLTLMFSYINKSGSGMYINTSVQVGISVIVFLIIMIFNITSALPLCEGWTIDDTSISLNKINTLKIQLRYVINKIFHTNYSLKGDSIPIDDVEAVNLYAVKNLGRGIIYGPIGYTFIVKFVKKDHTELSINSMIDFKNSRFVEGIEFLKERNVVIKDKKNLLHVIKENGDINSYLNFER